MDATQFRFALAALMARSAADEAKHGNWTYAAVRPQAVIAAYPDTDPPVKVEADCSDGVRDLCRVAGVPDDPAGNDYSDYGNSSSIWLHLGHAPLDQVEIGDIFTFGFHMGEDHACMAYDIAVPANPQVWNMGEQGQPVIHALSLEVAAHAGMTVTLCKLNLPPDPPPTAVETLQAMTGWYSWAAWRLGEGAFKPYGPRNQKVRPDVPKLIPAEYWLRLTEFLNNRHKGNEH